MAPAALAPNKAIELAALRAAPHSQRWAAIITKQRSHYMKTNNFHHTLRCVLLSTSFLVMPMQSAFPCTRAVLFRQGGSNRHRPDYGLA
jgi:hypothetical protein